MQTPILTNWTRTHGGPYYVEVGKNVEVKYHTKVNITVKHSTKVTTTTTTTNTV